MSAINLLIEIEFFNTADLLTAAVACGAGA